MHSILSDCESPYASCCQDLDANIISTDGDMPTFGKERIKETDKVYCKGDNIYSTVRYTIVCYG